MMRSLAFLLFFLILFSCREPENEITRKIEQTEDIDSAQNLFEQNISNANAVAFYKNIKRFCQRNRDTQISNRYINELFAISQTTDNAFIRNLGEQCKTFQQFLIGNSLESRHWAQKTLASSNLSTEVDKLDVYHLAGIAYYTPPSEIDSTLKYWKLGFQKAVEKNDGYRIYFFGNNLGTLFYELDMHVISREFFLRALSQAQLNNTVSSVLINNILNTLVKTENFQEAGEFYQKNHSYFEVDPSNFQNQSIYLNSIFINQRLKKYAKSDSLLRALSIKSVHSSLKSQYVSLHIRQFIHTGNRDFINAEIQSEAALHGISLLHNLTKEARSLDLPDLGFLWKIIEDDIDKKILENKFDTYKTRQLLFGLDLLMYKYKNQSTKKYKSFQLAYADIARMAMKNETEINHYITEVKRVNDLFDHLIIQNNELNHQKSIQRLLFILAFLLLIILIVSVLLYRKRIQFNQHREEMLTKEKEMLLRENAMSRRLVSLSKELIGFSKKIKSELDHINLNDNNAEFLSRFRSELLGYISINLEENPNLADYSLNDKNPTETNRPHNWEELNKMEKRVYTLIKDGFKPAEIAGLLGVSTQHIYNLKNSIKRKGIDLKNL